MQNLFRLPLVTLGLASLFAVCTPLLAQNTEPKPRNCGHE
jgi:hypothetical protein